MRDGLSKIPIQLYIHVDTEDKGTNTDIVSSDEIPTRPFPSPEPKKRREKEVSVNAPEPSSSGKQAIGSQRKSERVVSKTNKNTLRCKVCNKPYQDSEEKKTGNIWIGCSYKKCNVWVHAKCEGFVGRTEEDFSSLKYFCKSHRFIN